MDVKHKSVKVNMIMNAILTMSSFIFPLITFPYVSRILLAEGTGKVNFATSIIAYFAMFAQLGIPTYGVKACARVRDNKEELSRTAHEILSTNLFMCVIVYIAFFISLKAVPKFASERTLMLIVSITIFLNAIGVEWLYKAMEQYTYITVRSVIFKLVALIAMFLLVHTKEDYVIYGAISIFASGASNVLNFINVRKLIYVKPVGGYCLKRHFKMIAVFFAMSVATTVYTNLDTAMLGFMKTDTDVGYYSAAVKIKTILVSFVTSASSVLLPRMTYYIENNEKSEFDRIAKKTMKFIFLLASPCVIYFMIFAKEGIYALSGNGFAGSVLPMQIIMPTLLLIGITNVIGIQIMVPMGKEKHVLFSEIAGALVDLAINAALIPEYGAAGAAIGTLVAETVVLIWQYFSLKDVAGTMLKSVKYWLILIALTASTAASLWVKLLKFNDILAILVSAVLFFGIYLLIMIIFKEPLVHETFIQIKNKFKKGESQK